MRSSRRSRGISSCTSCAHSERKWNSVVPLVWQKSSFSGEAANCVNVAATADGTLRLRESDDPDVILVATRAGLSALVASIKENETCWTPASTYRRPSIWSSPSRSSPRPSSGR
ncbi:DUF397 domain-containing protein [Streptomyces sp. NPDC001832]|uniref:DUF397 domain-containing protein n=1 Tax=Streptomyces sp. NPDC001832 TaxID=3154527 RepID=UPI00331BBB89